MTYAAGTAGKLPTFRAYASAGTVRLLRYSHTLLRRFGKRVIDPGNSRQSTTFHRRGEEDLEICRRMTILSNPAREMVCDPSV